MTNNVKIKEGAAALSQALTAAGIKGPVVIRLTAADGAAFLEAANNSIPMTEREGVRACSIEEIAARMINAGRLHLRQRSSRCAQ